jgi:TonB family protein
MIRPLALALVLAGCAARAPQPAPSNEGVVVRIRLDSSGTQKVETLDSARVDSLRLAGVLLETRVDERPSVLMMSELRYPDDLRVMGIQGRVEFKCIIGRDGRVEPASIRVVRADDGGFIFNARQVLLGARFRPGKVRGVPVRTLVTIPFDYRISGARP